MEKEIKAGDIVRVKEDVGINDHHHHPLVERFDDLETMVSSLLRKEIR